MPRSGASFFALALLLLASGCDLPRDPQATSHRIRATHELRVGYSDHPPWVVTGRAEPTGIEPNLVRQFARQLGAKVLWTRSSETVLVQSLDKHELDLVIGGFDRKTVWKATAGVSQPYARDFEGKSHVVLAAPGENHFILDLDRFMTEHARAGS